MNPKILNLLKRLHVEKDKTVEFVPRQTICPVCRYLGFDSAGMVKTLRTGPDGVRYCECSKCGFHFRAISEKGINKENDKIEKVQDSCTSGSKTITMKKERVKRSATKDVKHKSTRRVGRS